MARLTVPDPVPFRAAWWVASIGAPLHGTFSYAPPPPGEVDAWAQLLAGVPLVLPHGAPNRVLVTAPTLPGLAWVLAPYTAWLGAPPAGARSLTELTRRAVALLAEDAEPAPHFDLAVRLDPGSGPPDHLLRTRLAAWLAPGGSLLLGYRAGSGALELELEAAP